MLKLLRRLLLDSTHAVIFTHLPTPKRVSACSKLYVYIYVKPHANARTRIHTLANTHTHLIAHAETTTTTPTTQTRIFRPPVCVPFIHAAKSGICILCEPHKLVYVCVCVLAHMFVLVCGNNCDGLCNAPTAHGLCFRFGCGCDCSVGGCRSSAQQCTCASLHCKDNIISHISHAAVAVVLFMNPARRFAAAV